MPRTNSKALSGVASPNTLYLAPASILSPIDDRNGSRRSRSLRSTTPQSQAWKRARVAELGIAPPPRLHHLPIDFERQTLTEGLVAGGLDRKIPALFAVLGVAQYLTQDALSQMLRDIAETSAPGSELVMQYVAPLESLETSEAALAQALAKRAVESGERWLSFYEPVEMERRLREAGFGAISQFGRDVATERYLRNRTDGLTLPAYFQMTKAQVG